MQPELRAVKAGQPEFAPCCELMYRPSPLEACGAEERSLASPVSGTPLPFVPAAEAMLSETAGRAAAGCHGVATVTNSIRCCASPASYSSSSSSTFTSPHRTPYCMHVTLFQGWQCSSNILHAPRRTCESICESRALHPPSGRHSLCCESTGLTKQAGPPCHSACAGC